MDHIACCISAVKPHTHILARIGVLAVKTYTHVPKNVGCCKVVIWVQAAREDPLGLAHRLRHDSQFMWTECLQTEWTCITH